MLQISVFIAKLLPTPSQIKNVLTFLAVLKSRDSHIQKKVANKIRQSSRFLAKLLPAPFQMKNVLAFFAVLKLRDGHIRIFENNHRKKCYRRNALNLKSFDKSVARTLSKKERFGVFVCFEVSR